MYVVRAVGVARGGWRRRCPVVVRRRGGRTAYGRKEERGCVGGVAREAAQRERERWLWWSGSPVGQSNERVSSLPKLII